MNELFPAEGVMKFLLSHVQGIAIIFQHDRSDGRDNERKRSAGDGWVAFKKQTYIRATQHDDTKTVRLNMFKG